MPHEYYETPSGLIIPTPADEPGPGPTPAGTMDVKGILRANFDPPGPVKYQGGLLAGCPGHGRKIELGERVRVNENGRTGKVVELLEGAYVFDYWIVIDGMERDRVRMAPDEIAPLDEPEPPRA